MKSRHLVCCGTNGPNQQGRDGKTEMPQDQLCQLTSSHGEEGSFYTLIIRLEATVYYSILRDIDGCCYYFVMRVDPNIEENQCNRVFQCLFKAPPKHNNQPPALQ